MTTMAMVMAALVTMATAMALLLMAMVVLVVAERPGEPRTGVGVRGVFRLFGLLRSRPGPVKSPRRTSRRPTAMARPLVDVEASVDEKTR